MTPPFVIAGAAGRERESWDDSARGNASWFTVFSSDMTPTAAMSAGIMELPPNEGVLEPHRHEQAEMAIIPDLTGR